MRVHYKEYIAVLVNKCLTLYITDTIFEIFYGVDMFTPIQVAVNVYTNKCCNIHSINVHTIYTDQMIVFTLFVIGNHKLVWAIFKSSLLT